MRVSARTRLSVTRPVSQVNLARFSPACTVLGPGTRAVLWVQGCSRRCPGCIAGPMLPFRTANLVPVDRMADVILSLPGIDGVTFSGGEPFEQASALADLCERLRGGRNISLMSYSGFTLEELRTSGTLEQRRLLDALDILIDGPFELEHQGDFLWRGSSNQRIHLLTDRHRGLLERCDEAGAGIEIVVEAGSRVYWQGVPPLGFEARLRDAMSQIGVTLTPEEDDPR